jgi:protease-4
MRQKLFLVLLIAFSLCVPPAMVHAWDNAPKSTKERDRSKDKDADKDDKDSSDDDKNASKSEDDDDDDKPSSLKEDKDGGDRASAKDKKSTASKLDPIKRLIEVKMDETVIAARAINIPLPGRTKTVRDMVERFEAWSKDDSVGAVLLNLDGLALAIPDVEELRSGVEQLKKADKKVLAFLNSGDPMSYLLACEADEIVMSPSGSLSIPGIGRVFPFMRGMNQLQGIEYDVITAGRFKYPGFLNSREPNKFFIEEYDQIIDGWFQDYVKMIADGRHLEPEAVKKLIDIALFDAEDAKNRNLVDDLAYYDDYCDRILRRTKFKKGADTESNFANITSLQDLLTAWSREVKKAQEGYQAVGPKIAVLHARGPIIDQNLGAGLSSSMIMRDEFVKTIEEIRKNKTIRAVVLRIDSPGGSGYASDVIWKKLRELDQEKPLVVSMGTVAGSGGYYIACPGRLIFAEPTTLTGSIGVLAIIANQASMLNRMDVNLAEIKRGQRSLFGSGHRDMKPEDREFLQKHILDFYEIFLDRVASGRKMSKNEVRKLAEGRVYTGRQAQKIGLVDRLGGVREAVAAVREMADIPKSAEIKLVHYPRPSSLGEFIEGLSGMTTMMEMATKAQMPAPRITFDSQVRYFAKQTAPLCWMATPDFTCPPNPLDLQGNIPGLLDNTAAPTMKLP